MELVRQVSVCTAGTESLAAAVELDSWTTVVSLDGRSIRSAYDS